MKKPSPRSGRRVRRILLVDDAELVLKTWARQCRRLGKEPLCASNGADAIAIARREKPEMAVIDMIMPGVSGLDVIRDLHKLRTRPFMILVSGAMSADAAMMGVEAGADDCHDKAVSIGELVERVESGKRLPGSLKPPTLRELEWQYIVRVLTDHGGNISQAAKTLGVVRQSLQRKIWRLSPTGRTPTP